MKYKIVPITENHIDGFWAAVDSVARERKYLAFLEGPPIEMTRTFVIENIKHNYPHFIAITDHKIIGWCDITSLNRPVFAHSGQLGIGVISPYRGHGIGESLMRVALDKAKQLGLTRVELTVREHNHPAIALYIKLGFVVEGVKRNAVKIEDAYENLIMMGMLL